MVTYKMAMTQPSSALSAWSKPVSCSKKTRTSAMKALPYLEVVVQVDS